MNIKSIFYFKFIMCVPDIYIVQILSYQTKKSTIDRNSNREKKTFFYYQNISNVSYSIKKKMT